jgi:hypothetical protein
MSLTTQLPYPHHQGSMKTADNPLPQSDLTHAPMAIDTLRKDKVCEVCGSTMDDGPECPVCGWIEPPDHFNNPDLSKAQENNERQQADGPDPDPQANAEAVPSIGQSLSHVNNEMAWQVSLDPRVAGQINPVERPVLPNDKKATNEPTSQQIVKDQTKPVTSSVRTAADFLAVAGATQRNYMDNHKTADSVSETAKPDVSTDVTGVGGVIEDSNEAASKADAQVDVLGIGGTGVSNVEADSHENVDQGNEHSKNIEAIPTKTFGQDDFHITDPVTSDPFPASADGVKSSNWTVTALDAEPFPADDGGLAGGKAVQGVDPADPVGRPDERVNVLEAVTTPENNSGPTTTWTGTDGNGVLRQADPVTNDSIALGESGLENGVNWNRASNTHLLSAFQLADLEVELGMIDEKRKYARVAELEQDHPAIVEAVLSYAQRIKTAGLAKQRRVASATRMPSLGRQSSVESTPVEDRRDVTDDSALFS